MVAVDSAVLKKFRSWKGTVPPGFFGYFLGNLTRTKYWAFPTEIQRLYDSERFEAYSGPSIDDNVFDWLIMLEAVASARGQFVMAAVGAGWGRWLIAAAFATKQFSGIPCRLIGVEAEPTHFRWMIEHFQDNGLDPAEHELIEAAAAGRSGQGWFYCGKADSWYGQSLIRDPQLNETVGSSKTIYNNEQAILVRTVDLKVITEEYARIDYLHMDIQGAEFEFLSSHPDRLDQKIKRALIGTHSSEIERDLRTLFGNLKWQCQYDIPLNGKIRVDDTVLTLGDGVQVWLNPKL